MESSMCCTRCGAIGFSVTDDSLYFCLSCGTQSQDIFEQGIDIDMCGLYKHGNSRKIDCTQISENEHEIKTLASLQMLNRSQEDQDYGKSSVFLESEKVEEGCPADFGSQNKKPGDEDIAEGLRLKYVEGIQIMIQLQCEALVEKFGVSPLVCGLAGPIWMRYLASTKVLDEEWANEEIIASETCSARKGEREKEVSKYVRLSLEPRTLHGRKVINVCLNSLKSKVPVANTLAICFLACHLSREAILPTDIAKWALEGTIPYLAAFIDIDKRLSKSSKACRLSSRLLFWPMRAVGAEWIEKAAATVAQNIGLHLPAVNFYSISYRYLKNLSLPVDGILPYACRIYEWLMPPDLLLSSNDCRLPTRVYVLAILVIAIRLLYNINGLGHWEKSLPGFHSNYSLDEQDDKREMENDFPHTENGQFDGSATGKTANLTSTPPYQSSELDASELLQHLETTYDKIILGRGYSKDMETYLKYCKDVVFAGLAPSDTEKQIISYFWKIYEEQDQGATTPPEHTESSLRYQSSRHRESAEVEGQTKHDCEIEATGAIGKLILDMEANGFWYLRPRLHPRTKAYLIYRRKVVDRKYEYLVHADYYILLRAFARLGQVNPRTLHLALLRLEKRLYWIEDRIDKNLHALSNIHS